MRLPDSHSHDSRRATSAGADSDYVRGESPKDEAREPMLAAGSRVGRFEIIRTLDYGGVGAVYLAHDSFSGQRVAVKQLSTHRSEFMLRFGREAQLIVQCLHKNICHIYDVGEHSGHPYIVLEYVEGQTLRQWLREHAATSGENAPVPPGRAVELMLPVVRALAYAHAHGIVHHDLKPENVMLTRSGTIKVLLTPRLDGESQGALDGSLDVNAGRMSSRADAHSSVLIGALSYMSPEQMNEGVINHRSNIWTVGIILFELVTGRHPIPTRSVGDLMRIAAGDEPMPSMCETMPHLGRLAGIIDGCLRKVSEHRIPNDVLLAELESWLRWPRWLRWLRWPRWLRWLRWPWALWRSTLTSWSRQPGPALLPAQRPRQRIQIVLDGDVGQLDEETRARLVKEAREKTGDETITIHSIKRGSILLELDISMDAAAMLRKLFESGDLKCLGGIPIRSIRHDHETSLCPAVIAIAEDAEAALAEFFVTAFSADELRQTVRSLSDGARLDAALPGTSVPLSTLASAAVHVLARHNLVGDALFERLEHERPHRRDEINRIRQRFTGTAASVGLRHEP